MDTNVMKPFSKTFMNGKSIAAAGFIKAILVVLSNLLCHNVAYAQQHKELKIHVVVDNAQAVDNAQVGIDYANNKTIGKTNENGIFVAQIVPVQDVDTCKVSIRAFMYQAKDTTLIVSQTNTHEIRLNHLLLQEVNVNGYKRIASISANKIVFDVDRRGFPVNAKADMALSRLPGVMKSGDAFSLPGNNTSASLRIDDRNVDIKELMALDLKDVERIEVLRHGTDESSEGGVINIIKKKHLPSQINGEISLSAANFSQERYSTFPQLTLRTQKLEFTGFFSGHISNQESWQTIAWNDVQNYRSDKYAKVGQYTANAKLSIFPTPKFKASVAYSFFGFNSKINALTHSDTGFSGKQNIREAYGSHNVNTVARYEISKNKLLNIKARFRKYKSTNESDMPTSFVYETGMNELSGELSYQDNKLHLIGANNELQIGYKHIYRQHLLNASTRKFYTQVYNLFANESFAIGGPFDAYVALRSEWTTNKMEVHNNSYHTLLPTIVLNAKGKVGSVSATYSRKINRPSVDYLNPETFYVSEHEMFQGNINLVPQYTNDFSLQFSKQLRSSYLSLYTTYAHTSNMVELVFSDNHDRSTYENAAQANIYRMGAGIYLPMLGHKLNLNLNIGMNHEQYNLYARFVEKTLMKNVEQSGWTTTSSLNLSYSAPMNWFFNLNGFYVSKSINLNNTTTRRPQFSLLVKKSLLKNHLELSLNYQDLFGWNQRSTTTYHFKTGTRTVITKLSSSSIALSATVNFGKSFRTRKVGTNINNDDITTK